MKILFIPENYYPNISGVEKLFKNFADKLKAEVIVKIYMLS
jgi:hypothetical protein